MKPNYDTHEFKTADDFRSWLDANHKSKDGIWLRLYKKGSGLPSVTQPAALDIVLCYGWIDGMRKAYDEVSYLQKYTPRRPKSLWSKRNIEYIQRLSEAGLMKPAGIAEVDLAKSDGRWDAAYDGPATMTFPESFMNALDNHTEAKARFESLSKSARYTIGWQLQTAKTIKTFNARKERIIKELNSFKI